MAWPLANIRTNSKNYGILNHIHWTGIECSTDDGLRDAVECLV